ncbi:MAG: hypothetical protein ACYTHJ_18320 [Planctomycetota bacterium]
MNRIGLGIVMVGFILTASTPTLAQLTNDPANVAGNSPFENAAAGAVGLRSPGRNVDAAVARQQMAILSPRLSFDHITEGAEPGEPTPFQKVFLLQAIDIIFEQLNASLLLLANIIIQQNGGDGLIPDLTDPGDNGGDNGDNGDNGEMSPDDGTDGDGTDGEASRSRRSRPLVDRILSNTGRKGRQ